MAAKIWWERFSWGTLYLYAIGPRGVLASVRLYPTGYGVRFCSASPDSWFDADGASLIARDGFATEDDAIKYVEEFIAEHPL